MRHARPDYARIQDPAGLIPEDEPVFIIRGQDVHAAPLLRFYATLVQYGGGDQRLVQVTLDHAALMDAWPIKKKPDLP